MPHPALGPRGRDRTKNTDIKGPCLGPDHLRSIQLPYLRAMGNFRENNTTLVRGLLSSLRELIFVKHLE